MTWRQAMQAALYGPGGFYARGEPPARHFRTSVHVSPGYAAAVLELLREVDAGLGWPERIDLVDVGAGRGELLEQVLAAAAEPGPAGPGVADRGLAGRGVGRPGAAPGGGWPGGAGRADRRLRGGGGAAACRARSSDRLGACAAGRHHRARDRQRMAGQRPAGRGGTHRHRPGRGPGGPGHRRRTPARPARSGGPGLDRRLVAAARLRAARRGRPNPVRGVGRGDPL